MKASLATSAGLHALVLAWALLSLSGPKTMDVGDVEALPVDIIPVESITQIQQGDKKAPMAEKSAPKPTSRPDEVANAENIGDNSVDLKTKPTPTPSPKDVEAAGAPKKADKAVPEPPVDPQPDIKQAEKPEPAPATEVAALPQPKEAVKPDPSPEPAKAEPAPPEAPQDTPAEAQPTPADTPEFASLPTAGPTPAARPQPPQAQTAKTPDRKPTETPKQAQAAASTNDSDFNEDEIATLLNKQKPSGGGAKRSQEQASLGGEKTTGGSKLSQSEMDALRGQIQKCWSIIPGMADGGDVRVKVTMRLDQTGAIEGQPDVSASGGSPAAQRALSGGAMRAVIRCAPYKLPADKYDAWADVVVNFDPSQMY